MTAPTLLRTAARASVLLGIWVLFSGQLDALHLSFGVVTAGAVAWADAHPAGRGWFPLLRFAAFLPWLLWQVVLANIRVARLTLSFGRQVRPALVETHTDMTDERGLAMLACAITLTPGTLAIEVEPGRLLVHALDPASAADVRAGSPADRIAPMFPEAPS